MTTRIEISTRVEKKLKNACKQLNPGLKKKKKRLVMYFAGFFEGEVRAKIKTWRAWDADSDGVGLNFVRSAVFEIFCNSNIPFLTPPWRSEVMTF